MNKTMIPLSEVKAARGFFCIKNDWEKMVNARISAVIKRTMIQTIAESIKSAGMMGENARVNIESTEMMIKSVRTNTKTAGMSVESAGMTV